MHLCLEQKLIVFSTLQPESSLQILSTFQHYSLLVSDCSQTPSTLKMKSKFPGEQAYYFLNARLYHKSHYLCTTFLRTLRGTMDLLPFCLSSSAPPTHKGKAPESCLRVEDNPRGIRSWKQARRKRRKKVLPLGCYYTSETRMSKVSSAAPQLVLD